VIREAQVPLGSAVYSLRAWAYARAVAPTLNTTSPPLRRAGPARTVARVPTYTERTPAPHGRAQHSARRHGVLFWSRGRERISGTRLFKVVLNIK
jgi:hypothetical protein